MQQQEKHSKAMVLGLQHLLAMYSGSILVPIDVYKRQILGPVTTSAAFGLGEHSDDPIAMYMADLLTVPVNLAGLPAISVPAGFTNEGLPVGIQLIGNYFQEKTIYQAAYAFEQANDYYLRSPQL